MASDDSKRDEYKLKQKERARLARKAAYAQQKAKLQERKAAQKADPEYKKAQLIKRAEQKQKYKELKAKHKKTNKDIDETYLNDKNEKAEERLARDKAVFSTLKLAKDIHKNSVSQEEEQSNPEDDSQHYEYDEMLPASHRPKLRLVKSDSCD